MDSSYSRALPSQLLAILGILICGFGCGRNFREPSAPLSMQLTSPAVTAGIMDRASTCDGNGLSPELEWSTPPAGTQSLALVVTDRDSPLGYNFVHWVIYNIPADKRELGAAVPAARTLPDSANQGSNDDGKFGYHPPCPPGHSTHRYDFVLYAVNEKVNLAAATKKELLATIDGHVLGKGELVAMYHR